eukprot:Gb_33454 [translate_table: standard]
MMDFSMASPEYEGIAFAPLAALPYNITYCPQIVCNPYCPQWCFPFPPPPPFAFIGHESDPNFSPLVIAIIGILASAFLLVSYYTIVAKYCTRWDAFRRHLQGVENDSYDTDNHTPPNESWPLVTVGLEESVIRSIPVCKYKRGDGVVEGTDCSVCLSEFQEDDSLRLLPKCSHAFHMPCIDTWLQSHSSCPLCRANIVNPTPPLPVETRVTILTESSDSNYGSQSQNGIPAQNLREESRSNSFENASPVNENDLNACVGMEEREKLERERQLLGILTPLHGRALSDLASIHRRDDDSIVGLQPMRRSVSMGSSSRLCISIADLLALHPGFEDENANDSEHHATCVESSQRKSLSHESLVFNSLNKHLGRCENKSDAVGDASKSGILHNVKGPVTMKRSFSGRKFFFFKYNRGRNAILPI